MDNLTRAGLAMEFARHRAAMDADRRALLPLHPLGGMRAWYRSWGPPPKATREEIAAGGWAAFPQSSDPSAGPIAAARTEERALDAAKAIHARRADRRQPGLWRTHWYDARVWPAFEKAASLADAAVNVYHDGAQLPHGVGTRHREAYTEASRKAEAHSVAVQKSDADARIAERQRLDAEAAQAAKDAALAQTALLDARTALKAATTRQRGS